MDARTATKAVKHEIYLKDYTPPPFLIEETKLCFELFEDEAVVTAVSVVRRSGNHNVSLVLDGGPYMELLSLAVDGQALEGEEYDLASDMLTVHNVGDQFELEIKTRLYPKENKRLEGLYHSGENFCTQCEAEGFRHITYFIDRPDNLVRFFVRIEADKNLFPVLLSNGNPGEAGDLTDGRHFAEWDDPFPKPCYLFALVAGRLGCLSDTYTTMNGQKVDLNIYAAQGDLDKCDHAMESLKQSMKWDEETFGLEYDLDVYNIVAVADFNMGAMENKGLNVFNTKYVLASSETATDVDFDNVQGVIGHEYFHNWTGNRVTCRDWFQLSLKEGLTVFRDQEFSSDLNSRAVKRLDDVRVLRMLQFPEDAGPLAHPVRPEKYIEINNFYTVTVYNKGAEVIRMMHRIIGADAFRKGMDIYFERHDGSAATCEDFVQSMEAASGVDLAQFRLWYSQAGTPEIIVERKVDGNSQSLLIKQSCPVTPGQSEKIPFHMPFLMGWLDKDGNEIQPELIRGEGVWTGDGCLLHLREAEQVFSFADVPEGAVPSLHRNFSCPVKLKNDLSDDELAFLSGSDTDAYTRWEAMQSLLSDYLVGCAESGNNAAVAPDMIQNAIRRVLQDQETDVALLAELMTLPSEIHLGQKMKVLMPEAIHKAREQMLRAIAHEHAELIKACYIKARDEAVGQDAKAYRKYANILLGYLAVLPEGEEILLQHYRAAGNMTDRIAALGLIVHGDSSERQAILEEFYNYWKSNDLVVDKWFAVQAQSKRMDTIKSIQKLIKHDAFVLSNPNRLRSVVSTFSMVNQVRFHDADGSGYQFLADMIIEVDKFNPQTAAKLVAPLGRWQRLDASRQELMKKELKRVFDTPNLSNDVSELVGKSLL